MQKLFRNIKVDAYKAKDGSEYAEIIRKNEVKTFFLGSEDFKMEIKSTYYEERRTSMKEGELNELMEYLHIKAYRNRLDYDLEIRVAEVDGGICYNLDADTSTSIFLSKGKCEEVWTPNRVFKPIPTFQNQVYPNLKADIKKLPTLIGEYFNLKSEEDIKLLTVYIVACFGGLSIDIPMLICFGEKGSSKSTFQKKLKRIIDPEKMESISIPKSSEDLKLRLNNSYLLILDNLSSISKSNSDLFATAISGTTTTKRKLYTDTQEVVLNLHSIIAINGIDIVAKEADLLDRSIMFQLDRIDGSRIRTEKEIWNEFNKVLPDILGASLNAMAKASNDKREVKLKKMVRLADWMERAVKVARVFGWEDESMAEIILGNRKKVDSIALKDNVVVSCLLEVMEEVEEYEDSVSNLFNDIIYAAKRNSIHMSLLPKAPNGLSKKLNEVRSNLAENYGLHYAIKNIGHYRQITIWRK